MSTYIFELVLIGTGDNEFEAWTDAIDSLSLDPGEWDSVRKLDDEEDDES